MIIPWWEEAKALHRDGAIDAALDMTFSRVDYMLWHQEADVNAFLVEANGPLDMMIAVLTATHPARDRLPARPEFFRRTLALAEAEDYSAAVLEGL